MAFVRLQKYLADRGVASRRKCEIYIKQGLIQVNGKIVTEMGIRIDPEKDDIDVDRTLKIMKQKYVYLMLNKPRGYVTSVTGPEQPKVMELLKGVVERVFPVGRLDKETSGLILLTNDGRFAYEMTHPKFEKEKEYEVTLFTPILDGALQKLSEGIKIIGRKTKPAKITRHTPNKFRIILKEGMNRQIRRMCRKVGHRVQFLIRIRIAGLWLQKLKPGEFRHLTPEEIKKLRALEHR